MNALPDEAARSDVDLVVEPGGLEPTPAPGIGIEQQGWAAPLVAQPVGAELQSDLAVDGHVGILLGEPQKSATGLGNRSILGKLLGYRLAIERQSLLPGRTPTSGGVEHRGDRTVPGEAPQRGWSPGRPQPGRAQCRGLAQPETWRREGESGAKSAGVGPSRIGLAGQDPREREKADYGDESARQSREPQR
jgi:hypothetical protein